MSIKLISRENEAQILQGFLDSDAAEFLALYGRRRVGKTFLVRQFFKNKPVIFFNVTGVKNAPLREQIRHFTKEIANTFYHGAPLETRQNWDDTFQMLTEAIKKVAGKKKIILFFDEFPWMATRNSRLLQNLDYYWNQYWSENKRIKLIICGSAASWIINKIIKSSGGLHNRITKKIRLEPFSLKETKRFLNSRRVKLNNNQVLQLYMVMGGVPYYLTHIQKGLSASQVIEQLAFSKESFLLEEFSNLFSSLFDHHEVYVEILRIVASNRYGIGKRELLDKLDKSHRGIQGIDKLLGLEESGFIKSFKPHFHKRRGIIYKVIDEYTLFYFSWIEPLKETLQEGSFDKGNWLEMQTTSKWNSWLGYAFEAICYKHISAIRRKLSISPAAIANTWRYVPKAKSKENGAEIDLLFDRMDDSITICEIKYSNKPFVIDKQYARNLINKRDVFIKQTRTKKQLFIAMIAANGLRDNIYADDLMNDTVTLDDLFEGE